VGYQDEKCYYLPLSFQRGTGFTLIEMLFSILVASILASLAVPSLSSVVKRTQLYTQQNDLLGDIMFARMAAITRGETISLCSANTELTACSGNLDDWHQGWIVYQNYDGTGLYDRSRDELLRVHNSLAHGSLLNFTYAVLAFNSRGFMSSNPINARFSFCRDDDDRRYQREIKMLSTGRPSRRNSTTRTCVVRDLM
jgi:prepilin-type N-terminal cleavage/methylation domain-containing protein